MKPILCHMKPALCAALAALTLAGGSAHAGAPAGGNIRREIQADYRRFTAAETTRQYDRIRQAVVSICSPSFTLDTPTGKKLDYAQFLAEMKATADETRAVRADSFRTHTLRREGDTLTETGVYLFSRTVLDVDGDFGAKGLTHQLSERTNYRSQWVKTGRSWRLQSLHLLARRQIVDGKPHG